MVVLIIRFGTVKSSTIRGTIRSTALQLLSILLIIQTLMIRSIVSFRITSGGKHVRSTFSKSSLLLYRTTSYHQTIIMSASSATTTVGEIADSKSTTTKVRTALDEISKSGEFKRTDAGWRNWIITSASSSTENDNTNQFIAETGRYHLYVSYACPWAHRTLIVRAIKGLQDCISVSYVHPTWQRTRPNDPKDIHTGWVFADIDIDTDTGVASSLSTMTNNEGRGGPFKIAYDNNEPDPLHPNVQSIRDIYELCKDTVGKYSVPILYDKKLNTIVSNESSDIIRMLNSEFNNFATNPTIDLYPKELQSSINEINDYVYHNINNGVYKCGFATTQDAYNSSISNLNDALTKITNILKKQRYLVSNTIVTEADIRLFVTLVRYDEVYTVYFKCNSQFIFNNSILINYCRDIYQYSTIADTVNMEQIKVHYYTSHPKLNYYSIIPQGLTNPTYIELLQQPHNRNTM